MQPVFRLWALTFSLFISISGAMYAQCELNFDVPSAPGIYPDTLFDAEGCVFYEETITFVLPADTTVEVIPGQELTLPFNSFTIVDILGLPEGMDWICNKDTADCVYLTNPDLPERDSLGCVRIFGTPETAGVYPISVLILANLPIVGDESSTFDLTLSVNPCTITSDCYAFELSDVCSPASLGLTNQVPSMGQEGFAYAWTVTNEQGFRFESTEEAPTVPELTEAGTYRITYEAVVDTVGTILEEAVIEAVNCDDLLSAGDIYWLLVDTAGNEYFSTAGNPLNNAGSDTPIIIGLEEQVLPEGVYEFRVWDNDDFFTDPEDDGCADGENSGQAGVQFEIPLPDSFMSGDTLKLTNQGLAVSLVFRRPITTFSCADTFVLERTPEGPLLSEHGELTLCEGESRWLQALMVDEALDSLQWYRNGLPIEGAQRDSLLVQQAGSYRVEAFNPRSLCMSASEVAEVQVEVVAPPLIDFDGDETLAVVNPSPDFTYEWFLRGQGSVGTGSSLTLAQSGVYEAVATSTLTGCQSAASDSVAAILASLDAAASWLTGWRVYPNPSSGTFEVEVEWKQPGALRLEVVDLLGRVVYRFQSQQPLRSLRRRINLRSLASGSYTLLATSAQGTVRKRILLRK